MKVLYPHPDLKGSDARLIGKPSLQMRLHVTRFAAIDELPRHRVNVTGHLAPPMFDDMANHYARHIGH